MFMKERATHTLPGIDVGVGAATYCVSHPSPSIRLVESTGQRPSRQSSELVANGDARWGTGRTVANRRLDSR